MPYPHQLPPFLGLLFDIFWIGFYKFEYKAKTLDFDQSLFSSIFHEHWQNKIADLIISIMNSQTSSDSCDSDLIYSDHFYSEIIYPLSDSHSGCFLVVKVQVKVHYC